MIIENIYYIIYNIRDPEFPNTLEELDVVRKEYIHVDKNKITIYWKPTVNHCAFAFQIALSIRTKLSRELLKYLSN